MNKSKIFTKSAFRAFLCIAGVSILGGACGKADGTLDFDNKLNGSWRADCDTYAREAVNVTESYLVKAITTYSKSDCSEPAFSIRHIWSHDLEDTHTEASFSSNVDTVLMRVELKFFNEQNDTEVVTDEDGNQKTKSKSSYSYCDLTGWNNNIARDVTGLSCNPERNLGVRDFLAADTLDYDLIERDDDKFYFGLRSLEADGSVEEKRPSVLDTNTPFYKF